MAEIDNLPLDVAEDVACAAEAAFCTGTGEFVTPSFRAMLSERAVVVYALNPTSATPDVDAVIADAFHASATPDEDDYAGGSGAPYHVVDAAAFVERAARHGVRFTRVSA